MSNEHDYAPPARSDEDPAAPVSEDAAAAITPDETVEAGVFAARYAPQDDEAASRDASDAPPTWQVPEEPTARAPRQRHGLVEWINSFFSGPSAKQRLAHLNKAIDQYPDAPSNYLLRGELYLEARHYHDATEDFYKALELAADEYVDSSWGILSASVRDRAMDGLMTVARKQS